MPYHLPKQLQTEHKKAAATCEMHMLGGVILLELHACSYDDGLGVNLLSIAIVYTQYSAVTC